jgi:hypothetical protein
MKPATLNGLYKKHGSDKSHIRRWLDQAGVKLSDGEAACGRVVKQHQQSKGEKQQKLNLDQGGMTWSQRKNKEAALKLALDNQERAKTLEQGWVTAEWHLSTVKSLCTKLDQAPAKAKSQLGLTEEQRVGLQKIIDDIRLEYANTLP